LGGAPEDRLVPLTRAIKTITQWCKTHRHLPLEEQHQM
jgi:hypothetical protein